MLNFHNVSLWRGNRLLLSDVTFVIHRGYKLGLTGANGTGKSSFLQLVLGELAPDQGNFEFPKDLVFACVAQEAVFSERPAIEVVIDGDSVYRQIEAELETHSSADHGMRHAQLLEQMEQIEGYGIPARAAKLMQRLGFQEAQLNRPAQEFSGGWQVRLNLARALMCRSDVLLLDEPTNHLDLDAVIWLQEWLKAYPGTLIMISHDREFLDEVTDHVAHIENGSIKVYTGNYTAFERLRADDLAQRAALYDKQQREVQHLQSFVDRFRAKATKAKQAQSRLKALQRMDLIVRARSESPFDFEFQNPKKTPAPLIRVSAVKAGYDHRTILDAVDLVIRPGDRIGLLGPNGAGKTTLIKLLAGTLAPIAGKIETAKDLFTGYFAQHQLEQLNPLESPLQHLQTIDRTGTERELRRFLGGFAFTGDLALEPVANRSGGEKARLVLALLAYQRPNLLLLDEPTNHLDIQTRDALSMALQEYAGAVVIVSHDRYLLRTLCDRFLLVQHGKLHDFDGDLDDYRQLLRQIDDFRNDTGRTTDESKRAKRREEAERRKNLRPLRYALEQAECTLETLQYRLQELETALSDTNLYTENKKDRLKRLLREKGEIDRNILESEEIWLNALQNLEEAEKTVGATNESR